MKVRRSTLCTCGGDVFERTYATVDGKLASIWRCDNCSRVTPRKKAGRRTLYRIAVDAYLAIKKEWEPVDKALEGYHYGIRVLHGSSYCTSLQHLFEDEHPHRMLTKVRMQTAREELARARQFVLENGGSL